MAELNKVSTLVFCNKKLQIIAPQIKRRKKTYGINPLRWILIRRSLALIKFAFLTIKEALGRFNVGNAESSSFPYLRFLAPSWLVRNICSSLKCREQMEKYFGRGFPIFRATFHAKSSVRFPSTSLGIWCKDTPFTLLWEH